VRKVIPGYAWIAHPGLPPVHGLKRGFKVFPGVKAFPDRLFNRFPGLAGALLDAADQFVPAALSILQVVLGKLRVFSFQLALGDVPVAFDNKGVHRFPWSCLVYLHGSKPLDFL